MDWLSMSSEKNKQIYQRAIGAFALVCVLVGVLCCWYYLRLQDTIKAEGRDYIQEISEQSGININKIVVDHYAVLYNVAAVLKQLQVNSYLQLQQIVEEQKGIWNVQEVLFFDCAGTAYDCTGKRVALDSDQYLQAVIVKKKAALSTTQVINGEDSAVFAIPLEAITVGGVELVAVAAAYDLSTLDRMLAMTMFQDKGYAHIVRGDGTSIVRSSSPHARQSGYNILNSLSSAVFYGGKSIKAVQTDIVAGRSGNAEFTLDGSREYMTYLPLGQQQWSLITFVPVEVVNTRSNMMMNLTLVFCGAITLAFALLLGSLLIVFYRNKRELERIAYVDPVTGGNTIDLFYLLARTLLNSSDAPQYALVYTNIEKFKVLNEQSGRGACDESLRGIERGIGNDLDMEECMGRLIADNFCVLVKCTEVETLAMRFDRWMQNGMEYAASQGSVWLPLIVEFGIYIIDTPDMSFPSMIDRAKLALQQSRGEFRGKLRYAIYDEKVRQLLFREKQLEDRMEDALKNNEFQVYFQPKYRTQAETVGGAEALARWQSAHEGLIYPDEFIPLFEKNGFIIPLDCYMFESVCKILRKWLDAGLESVKLSVNCSRMHLRSPDFVEKYCRMADRYQVPHELLEIELTENAVFEDVGHLSTLIREIRAAGFGCAMDDFGSGYSSLNLIQDIPVDTLKLDKVFFRDTGDAPRAESIIASILTMSHALQMETVAEGVEEEYQVAMLKRLNCDYVQGFYFAKPMQVEAFEQLLFGKIIDEKPEAAITC